MAVIDAEGLFAGNRMGMLTDGARLHFPWLLVAANGFGRLEINYTGIVARVYQAFRLKPTQVELFGWVQEYHAAGLLFLYECGGQYWGQWDTRPELLPRFKTARDRRSPTPPEPDFSDWKRSYREHNRAVPKSITNLSEVLPQDFGNVSEGFRCGGGIGIGVGVGVGDGKTLCSSGDEHGASLDLMPPTLERTDDVKTWFDAEFWPTYPRKTAKPQALKAARRNGKTVADRVAIMECLSLRLPALQEQFRADGDYRPYPASWLNQTPWIDPVEAEQPMVRKGGGDSVSSGIEGAMRLLDQGKQL